MKPAWVLPIKVSKKVSPENIEKFYSQIDNEKSKRGKAFHK